MTRVIFLSNASGGELYGWLLGQPCDVVYGSLADAGMTAISPGTEYDLGLNFLGERKIPPEELAKADWVNFHPGPLPECGGRNLAYNVIMEGLSDFGATVHYMSEEYDAGDIIECVRFPIEKTDHAGDLVARSRQCLEDLFKKWVPELLKGRVPSQPQDSAKRRYWRKELISDRVVLSPLEERRIRALTCPPHKAYAIINGRKYLITPED